MKYIVAAACAYEATAIVSGKIPTITRLSETHRWVGPFIIGVLSVHFYDYGKHGRNEM